MTVHIGTVDTHNRVYSTDSLCWEAQSTISGGAASTVAGSTQVTVSNYSTTVSVSGYVAPSTTVTVSGYVAPSTTVTVTGYVAPSTTVTVTGYVAPSTQVSVTGYVAPLTQSSVSISGGQSSVSAVIASGNSSVTISGGQSSVSAIIASGNSSVTISGGQSSVSAVIASGNSSVTISAGNSSVTCTPVAGSTWNVRALCSSAADMQVTSHLSWGGPAIAVEGSTRAVGTNSTMAGLAVRSIGPDCTSVSVRCTSTGNFTAISSAATGIYVYAYQVCTINGLHGSTTVTLSTIGIVKDGAVGAQLWCWPLSTVSPQVVNNAVTPPSYLFRTAAGNPLVWNQGATSSGADLSFSFWRE